ncbi:MAG: hypothetical protein GY835_04325 [bacterium]|nr:hypothetical protein [bacterium]
MKVIKAGKIAGIQIRIHPTLPFLLMGLGIVEGFLSGVTAGLEVITGLLFLFIFVLLHELGHCLAAGSFGIRVGSITLYPFGGVAAAGNIPRQPRQEILIAIAGPAVNLILAILIVLILWLSGSPLIDLSGEIPLLTYLLYANIALLTFNLIPAFPLDGGRVLRAVLAIKLPYTTATRWAVRIGMLFSLIFLLIVLWKPRFIMLGVIGIFLLFAGRRELRNVKFEDMAKYSFVREHLRQTPWYLADRETTVGEVCAAFADTPELEYCVVDLEGFMYATLTRNEVLSACLALPHYLRIHRIVDNSNRPLTADTPLGQALPRLRQTTGGWLPVIDDLEIVGLVFREDLEAVFPVKVR